MRCLELRLPKRLCKWVTIIYLIIGLEQCAKILQKLSENNSSEKIVDINYTDLETDYPNDRPAAEPESSQDQLGGAGDPNEKLDNKIALNGNVYSYTLKNIARPWIKGISGRCNDPSLDYTENTDTFKIPDCPIDKKTGGQRFTKFITLLLVKLAASNFIVNSVVLSVLFLVSVFIALMGSKREWLANLINHITGYYEYQSYTYQETNPEYSYKPKNDEITDPNCDSKTTQEFDPPPRFEFLNNNDNFKNQTAGSNNKNNPIIGLNKRNVLTKDYLDAKPSKYNIGTDSNPLYLNLLDPSLHTTVKACTRDLISRKKQLEKDNAALEKLGANKETLAKLGINNDTLKNIQAAVDKSGGQVSAKGQNVSVELFNGPITNVYKNISNDGSDLHTTITGSCVFLNDNTELVKAMEVGKIDPLTNKRHKLSPPSTDDKLKAVNFGGVVNIDVPKKTFLYSALTRLAFMGIDFKKLFLDRWKYCSPPIDCSQSGGKVPGSMKFKELINNWPMLLLLSTSVIIYYNNAFNSLIQFIPPNTSALMATINTPREFIYTGMGYMDRFWNLILQLVTSYCSWIGFKLGLSNMIGQMLSSVGDENTIRIGNCTNLAFTPAPPPLPNENKTPHPSATPLTNENKTPPPSATQYNNSNNGLPPSYSNSVAPGKTSTKIEKVKESDQVRWWSKH